MMMCSVPPMEYGCKLAHVEHFLHDALAGERGVAVDDDGHAALALRVADAVLLRADAALHDRADEFQVARIEAQRQVNLAVRARDPIGAVAEVVLHVAAAVMQFGIDVGELAEDLLRALAHDVGQHVQPAAVGHAEHDFLHAVFGRALDRHIQQRNQALAPFERKALRARGSSSAGTLRRSRRR